MRDERYFYATADEQRAWLFDALEPESTWCAASFLGADSPVLLDRGQLTSLTFEGPPYAVRVFLGHLDLAPVPIERPAGRRSEIDLVNSRAVQFLPSLKSGDILLEGQLAIMRRSSYKQAGVDYRPLKKWFAALAQSLQDQIHVEGLRLLASTATEPAMPASREVLISRGAAAWHERGGRLKQFPESHVEYQVESREP